MGLYDGLFSKPKAKVRIMAAENIQAKGIDGDDFEYLRDYSIDVEMKNLKTSETIATDILFIRGDFNSGKLNVNFLWDGQPMNVSGCTITANTKEQFDSSKNTIPVEILDGASGKALVSELNNVIDTKGTDTIEFVIQKGKSVLYSQMYSYKVNDSLGEGEAGTEAQMTQLQTMIDKCDGYANDIDAFNAKGQEAIDEFNKNASQEFSVDDSDIYDIMNMVNGLD